MPWRAEEKSIWPRLPHYYLTTWAAENGPPLPQGETFKPRARHLLAFRLSPLQFSLQVRNEMVHEVDVSFQETLPIVSDITLFCDHNNVIPGMM